MDFSLNVTRTKDAELIKSLLLTEGLWESISDDNADKSSFSVDVEKDCWLLICDEDLVVGCYRIEPVNSCYVIAHINILPKHRKRYSWLSGIAFYEWIVANNINKVTVNIPVIYENVKKYCAMFGLSEEGINRQSILKGGEFVDQWIMGITNKEIKEVLNEFN